MTTSESDRTNAAAAPSVDPAEVARFAAIAERWWDPEGSFRPLHQLNPVRIAYVRDAIAARLGRDPKAARPLEGVTLLDIGCGGGLIAEPMARLGARVTAIDVVERNIEVARLHAVQSGLEIDYRHEPAEALAARDAPFDVVLALEVVEHVVDLSAFLATCAALLRPDGAFFAATLNRTPQSFAFGIVAAEYMLGLLPRGTHRWSKFVRPSELVRELARAGIHVERLDGVSYDPWRGRFGLTRNLMVNYMAFATKNITT
ncbi:MAG: bifunctional 2-polyprenyl-6-hydroxyphenol methylase/3-demethylubiquinol 3-O-methyltransferase UbiG, partial [Alphaproteobacteria bacterium]|nr:bifunctional 2-polyprenyl-6-hydroxyphenol methylase/3-demethylubiquinol 3-O-methyltransferase UbiG [Alphaproteobacteria bacterium]